MRLFFLVGSLSTMLLTGTCNPTTTSSTAPAAKIPQLKQLERTWLHSQEEDQGDVRVYRPNTYAFPPARGRTGFQFDHNGLFTQYDIAPTDGLEGRKGQWKADGSSKVTISLDDKRDPDYSLEIVSLEKDLLKVRRVE